MPEDSGQAAVATSGSGEDASAPSSSSGDSQVYDHRIGESDSADLKHATHESQDKANGDKVPKGSQKPLSRYERTKRERSAFRAERDAFQRERNAFMQARAQEQQAARAEKYTISDLEKYLPGWQQEAQAQPWDEQKQQLVSAAQAELQRLRAAEQAKYQQIAQPVMGTPEHRAEWERTELELAQADPEFMRDGTKLDAKLREIMRGPDGNIYRQHPRGIVAAYHRAKMELLQVENEKLENDLKRYRGLTSIGGGAPGRVGSGRSINSLADFAKLSTKDQRAHLLANSDSQKVPWF